MPSSASSSERIRTLVLQEWGVCAVLVAMLASPWPWFSLVCCFWQAVKVNYLGKWKTALQMVAMSSMLAARRGEAWLGHSATGATLLMADCTYLCCLHLK